MADAETFSDRLKWAMNRARISGRALAQGIGVSPSAVRKWLAGKAPRETLLAICALHLDVDPLWLAKGLGDPETPQRKHRDKAAIIDALRLWHYKRLETAIAEVRKQLDELLKLEQQVRDQGLYDALPLLESPLLFELKDKLDELTPRRYERAMPPEIAESTWNQLVADVKRLTTARGSRVKLARLLNVRPQRLNEWINQKTVPRGGISLLLRDWVRAEEARQKQEKGSEIAETTSKPQTRQRKSR